MQKLFGDKVTPRRHFARQAMAIMPTLRPWVLDAPWKQAFPHYSDKNSQIHSESVVLINRVSERKSRSSVAATRRDDADLKNECVVTFRSFVGRSDNRDGKLFDWWRLLMCLEIRLFNWQIIWVCFNSTLLWRHEFQQLSKALDGDDKHGPAIQRVVALRALVISFYDTNDSRVQNSRCDGN